MRQIYKFILVLTLALQSALTSLAHDFEAKNSDGVTIYYSVLSETDKTVYVTWKENGSGSYSGNIAIPERTSHNGTEYSVVWIGPSAFRKCTGLTSINIPNSVTSIANYAFANCTSLTAVTIPNSVTSIGDNAFWRCTGLSAITLPNASISIGIGTFSGCTSLPVTDNLRYADTYLVEAVDKTRSNYNIKAGTRIIGYSALSDCTSLVSVTIPNSVTAIYPSAFWGCTSLTSVTIPNSVTSISYNAFAKCTSLASVTIPNSVTSIGICAFWGCTNLSAFYGKFASADNRYLVYDGNLVAFAPNGISTYTIPNSVTSIGDRAFADCIDLKSITIPNSTTSIRYNAFAGCSGLTSVTIGKSVTQIERGAFADCTGLTSIYAKPITPPTCDSYQTFEGINRATTTLFVPQSSIEVYKAADIWCEFLNISPDTSSVIEVTEDKDPDAHAVYYDLNGQVVEHPESGKVYIRQRGESIQKIIY